MTTKVWTENFGHTSDADFREWGQNLSQALADVGLVKTSDTGQIDWTTVTRLGSNTTAGYEIWRYPDSSLYMRWEFGTAILNNNIPRIRVQVGLFTNGAGTLTGIFSEVRSIFGVANALYAKASRTSYMCFKDGFFGFLGYQLATVGPPVSHTSNAFFAIAPTTNANGVRTNDGFTFYWRHSATSGVAAVVQALNPTGIGGMFSYWGPVSTVGDYCLVPHGITSSLVGVDSQAFAHWTAMPRIYPVMQLCTVLSTEVPTNSTFNVALVGSTERTYLALDNSMNGTTVGTTTFKLAMLWE